jgi:hypothetical protein
MKYLKIIRVALVCVVVVSAGAFVTNAEVGSTTSTSSRKILPAVKKSFEQRDIRNTSLDQRDKRLAIMSSSTERMRELRASSTMMFRIKKEQKKDILKKMRTDAFLIRKNALENELKLSLLSITKIREQISQRITNIENRTNEKTTVSMADARDALITADQKIAKAKIAIELFSSTTYTPATGRVSTSTEITLDKPRKIGDDAIRAVKDARDSLKNVINVVSHSLGLKVGDTVKTTNN